VLVAGWVFGKNARRARNLGAVLGRVETRLFVGSLLIVGLGSAFYHASLAFVGQVIDVSGMYLIATFMLLHRLGSKSGMSPIWRMLGFAGVNAALMTAQVTAPSLRRVAFGALLVIAVVTEWTSSRAGRRWLGVAALLMGLAFALWALDTLRIVCAPESLLQGHALWHVLGAIAAGCLFRSYEADS
jgi:dihydroceramidase